MFVVTAYKCGCPVTGYIIGTDRNGEWHLNEKVHKCKLNPNLEAELDFRYALYKACKAEKGGIKDEIDDRVVKQGYKVPYYCTDYLSLNFSYTLF